jgi:hypothetical protein
MCFLLAYNRPRSVAKLRKSLFSEMRFVQAMQKFSGDVVGIKTVQGRIHLQILILVGFELSLFFHLGKRGVPGECRGDKE